VLLSLSPAFGLAPVGFAEEQAVAASSKWPQFLGPERNGISAETGLLREWPLDGPAEVWRVQGGIGMSGVTVSSGRAVTLIQRDEQQWLLALDVATGKTLHAVPIAPEFQNAMGAGPRSTPALDGDRAYAFTGEGVLAAVDLASGQLLWKRPVVQDLGGKPAEYGMACSPLVWQDHVIVTVGAPKGTVAAFDKQSGAPKWVVVANGGKDTAGYSSPAILNVGGEEQLVVFEGKAAIGIDVHAGRLLWRYGYETDFDCNIATPIAHRGRVFISSGENHGCSLLSVEHNGPEYKVAAVWDSHGPGSVFRNEWQTSALVDGSLYGFDNVGSAGPVTHLACIDADTGERKWQSLRFGKGNLIAADGKLFISTLKGELVIAQLDPQRFVELGRKTVLRQTRQAPALANGRLFLRDDREIVCLNVRQPK